MIDQSSVSGWSIETASCFNGGEGTFGCHVACQTKQAWPSPALPIKTGPVEDDWRLSLNLGEPREPRACQGTGPTRRHSPCRRLYGATDKSWGFPWRGEPTRQEPALLPNHDGAAAPGPARLCNDLKQESRPQAPTPFQNMGHKSEDEGEKVGPGTWNPESASQSQPHLNSLNSTRLDSTLNAALRFLSSPRLSS